MRINLLGVISALTIVLSSLAIAAEPPMVTSAPVAVVPAPVMSNDAAGLVSLDFQEADIRNVLKVLAFKTGVNIVAGPEVIGSVSIQLKDVPWQKALEVILSTYGFGYEQRGNIIKVMSIENLKKYREDKVALEGQEPLITKTFLLSFAKASDVVESLGKMKTERGSVNFDQRTNTIIVRDVQANLDLISEVVKSLDSVTPQVLIEAKIIETTLNNDEKMGVEWNLVANASGGKRATSFPFTTDATSRFVNGQFPVPDAASFKYGTLDVSQFSATMRLLTSRTDTHILSNPRIVTLDNQTAKIVVGSQYPIPLYTYNAEQAKLQISGWEYKDIGIIFEVTPHVNNPGLVTLDLQPKISSTNGNQTVENTQIPIIQTEETKTKVMIVDGQTLVIAGLIKEDTTVIKKKVPFLGDIPLLGLAFQHNDTVKNKKEILIFITPHIITPNASPVAPTKENP